MAYTSQSNKVELLVVVFAGRTDCRFADPVISTIALDPARGDMMTAEFMVPISTVQSSYTYEYGEKTEVAITSFFDNYGVMGARIVAPVRARGTLEYEFKGQNGALAGQRATFLDQRIGGWMGSGAKQRIVGLVSLS